MPLRLQATEDDVYHLMDLKEQYFIMTAICSVAEGISAYFFIYQKRCWDLVYLCTALALAIILLLRQAIKISRRIMEAENCYMALEEDSLAVCQPEKNGKYESCRIFYDEMDKIVEGSRRGIPEFYIVIRKEGKEQKSFFLLDEEEQERDVFCVRSFGFDNQGFMEFYRKLRWIVPGRTRIIGTKTQEVWKLRRPNIGICTAAGMLLGYGDYEKATFLNGYADHYSVTASWQLEDTKLTDVYKELMQNYGRKTDKDIKAVVRITTSDVGVSGANIFYSLQEPTRNVILGNALKVTHKNCKGMEDFTENIESIFDYYREVLKGVMRLCDIWIEHPANAMAGIMKQAGFGKKLLAETVEQFKATTGNEPCSAYEIYCGICESITIARQEKTNERGLLALEEKIAGCVSKRWHEYDIPGTVKY